MSESISCPDCGATAPAGHRFCGHCGAGLARLASPAPATVPSPSSAAARRPVAVLSADLANYTSASSQADPEKIYLMVGECLRALADCVHGFGGRVDRFLGDGLLAKFGLPEAHEDDSERAVRAALAMQQSMEKLRERFRSTSDWEMHLRIGIDSGSVIAGRLGGAAAADASIYGNAVNVASRLQAAARTDTVLISDQVSRLVRPRFELSKPIRLQLRGLNDPVLAYEVLSVRSTPERSRGLAGRYAPMVGRDAEFHALVDRFQRLAAGRRGTVVFVFGEAGVGKSRLVEEVVRSVGPSAAVLGMEGSPHSRAGYSLVIQLLQRLLQIESSDDAGARREKIARAGIGPSPSLPDAGRVIGELLGAGESLPDRLGPSPVDHPQSRQQALLAAVRRLITWRARSQPLLLLCEDAHWADRSSLEVLSGLVDLVEEIPLGILLTSRPEAPPEVSEFLTHVPSGLSEAPLEIRLRELMPEQSELLLDHLLEEARLPMDVRRAIAIRSGGNPFLLEEIVRMLLDRQVLVQAGERWQARPDWESEVGRVPETIAGLILQRLDRLPVELQRVLQVAAVLGREFAVDLLAPVAMLDLGSAARHLEALEGLDFVRRSVGHREERFIFRHALTQKAVYDTLLHSTRAVLHGRAAEMLEGRGDLRMDETTAMLAYHHARSDAARAVPYLLEAGRRATARFANGEALRFFEQAEEILTTVPDPEPWRAELLQAMGDALVQAGRTAEAEERYRSALQHAPPSAESSTAALLNFKLARLANARGDFAAGLEQLENAQALAARAEAVPGCSPADLALERGWAHFSQGELPAALDTVRAAIELAEGEGNYAALAGALNVTAAVLHREGKLREAVGFAERALRLQEELGHTRDAAIIQSNLSILYIQLAEWRQAEQNLRQALFVLKEIGDTVAAGRVWNTLGFLLMNQGRFSDSLYSLDQALALAIRQSHTQGIAARRTNRGRLWLKAGEPSRALEELDSVMRLMGEAGDPFVLREAKALLAEAQLRLGNRAAAESLVGECLAQTSADEEGELAALVYRVAGELEAAKGRITEALSCLEKSRVLFHTAGNAYEGACVEQRLGRISTSFPQHPGPVSVERGRQNLTGALKTFRALGASKDARDTEEYLGELPGLPEVGTASGPHSNRWVVVMHVSLSHSDPDHSVSEQGEGALAVMGQAEQALRRVAEENHGSPVHTERGLAMVFGSLELTAALRGALAVQEAVLHLNRPAGRDGGHPLVVAAIGLAAGSVPEAGDLSLENHLIANVAQVGRRAAALADLAEAGTILVSSTVEEMASAQFVFDHVADALDQRLPEAVYRLRHARAATALARALPTAAARTVGRERERERLLAFGERASRPEPGEVCYLEGEAGTGKTRLVEELRRHLEGRVFFLHGKCESYRNGMSYWPFLDLLHTDAGQRLDEAGELRMLLRVRPADRERHALVHDLPPEGGRAELYARFRAALAKAACERPLLLVLEDVHWVDLASLDLLEFLIPITADHPVSLLLVGRAELPGPHRALIALAERACRERFGTVSLSDLSAEDGAGLARAILGTDELPPVLNGLWTSPRLNPLLLEETLRLMVERGWLDLGRPAGESVGPLPLVPATFKEVMLARLDCLEQDTQHLLQVASVIGETFDKSVLRWVAGQEDLDERLAELADREFVRQSDPDNPLSYQFKHTLTRETVYSTLLTSKRTLLHQRVGEALEALFADRREGMAELLAHHYENSSLRNKAVDYLVLAGQASAKRYARDEAVSFYRRALALLPHSGPTLVRQRCPVVMGLADALAASGSHREAVDDLKALLELDVVDLPPLQQASVHRRLGRSLAELGELHDAEQAYRRARTLLIGGPELESVEAAAQGSREHVLERVQCETGMAGVLLAIRHADEARDAARWALALAQWTGLPANTAEIWGVLGQLAFRSGDLPAAARAVGSSLEIRRGLGDRAGAAGALSNLGVLAVSQLDWDGAEAFFRDSLAMRREIGDLPGRLIGHNNLGQLLKDRGRWAESLAELEEAIAIGAWVDTRPQWAQSWVNLAEARALAGQSAAAWGAFDKAQQIASGLNLAHLQAEAAWKRAEASAALGFLVEAQGLAERSLKLAQVLGSRPQQAEARRVLSRIERERGRPEEARPHVEQFSLLNRAGTDRFTGARFDLEQGLCLLAARELAPAEEALRSAAEVFDRVGAHRYLPQALTGLERARGMLREEG